jgi:hypothetical protein
MNKFIRFVPLLACGCFAMPMACDSSSDGDTVATTGGAGGDGTASGTGGESENGGAGGAGAVAIEELCPEIVGAGCAVAAAFLPDEATCAALLPMAAGVCGTEMEALMDCTGPDPEGVTCDETSGAPTTEACATEWSAMWVCAEALNPGGGGAGGGAGAGG